MGDSELVWARRPREVRRPALSVERIVRVAIATADADGLDALSMRRMATDLGSGTTSLYRYVTNRDELVDLMTDSVLGEEPPEPLTGDWRTDLRAVATRQRVGILRHPWLGAVMTTRPALGPNALRAVDLALTAAAGLTPDITVAADIIALIGNYVFGAASQELAEREAQRRTGQTEEQWRASVGPYIRQVIEGGGYPQFARQVIEAEDRTFAERFEFGLACLLDGIGARCRP
ncbi:TetR/AcrR family transcriptional regulator [Rugosimonospora acidiphila]